MKAITLHRPWSWAVAHADKNIENRTWAPPNYLIGSRIAIHAGKQFDDEGWEYLTDPDTSPIQDQTLRDSGVGHFVVPYEDACDRGIVAVTTLAEVLRLGAVPLYEHPWYCGPVGWRFEEIVALPHPIECRGHQGLWDLPKDVENRVQAEIVLVVSGGMS